MIYYLELGDNPAKNVILKKRLKFKNNILDDDINFMIKRVYEEEKN